MIADANPHRPWHVRLLDVDQPDMRPTFVTSCQTEAEAGALAAALTRDAAYEPDRPERQHHRPFHRAGRFRYDVEGPDARAARLEADAVRFV